MVKAFYTSACLFGALLLAPAADFYVSTTGRASGTGSITDPVDWATAMFQAKSPAKPGDTLWIRGGTYRGPFETYLYGQSGKPITIRAYPGERVIIDGAASSTVPTLYVYGQYNIWRGIEVINSSTDRTPGVGRPAGVYMECLGGKLINSIIHDVGLGFGFWTPTVDGEMYGCLIYNVGFEKANNVGNGHSVYSQNDSGTKKIHDNILCNSFGFGFNIYTESQQIRGYDFQGNISFNAGASSISDHRYSNLFVGGYNPSARLNVVSNFTYTAIGKDGSGARFSYGQPDNEDMVCTDNVFIGSDIAFQARYWHTVNLQRNVIYTSPSQLLMWAGPFNILSSGSVWNNNQYYGVGTKSFQAGESTTSFYDFAGWKGYSGRDQNSTASSGGPTGVRTVVRPNKYEPKRGHVAIYNWDQLDRVAVDLSSVLQPGDRFEVRNAQNYFGTPVLSGTYGGGTLLLPTTNLYAAAPAGMAQSNVKPDKSFNSYVIVGQSGPPIANTAPIISTISNQNTPEDSAVGPVSFTVADAETSAGSLLLSAGSSNPTLVPNANVTLGGSGGNRTVTVTPAANQSGVSDITVTVSDGIASASRTFTLTVSVVNDAPTISAILAQTTSLDTPTSPMAFTIGDAETALGSLSVTATSSDQNLVPNSAIAFGGSGANRTVTITPAAGQSGTATITLSVSDGLLAATSAFTLTVTPGNTAPTISDLANRSAGKGQSLPAIAFTVGDNETSPGSLAVTTVSANQILVPNSGLALGGDGVNRTLTVTPAAGQTGSVTITLTVTDNALAASDSFTLTVTNVIVPPVPLVAHWKFDEGSGASALDSVGNNHGTLLNLPGRTSGVSNGALGFNGTSQYVTVPDANPLDVTTNFSVSLWLKPSALVNAASGRKDLLKKFTSYWLLMNYPDNDGKLSFAFNLGSPVVRSTTTSWTANQWVHAVATYGGGTMKLYVNGVLENSLATSVVPSVNTYALEIGGNSNQDFYFGGAVDDVRLYGGALNADEIAALYNALKPAPGANTAPTITSIASQSITADHSTAAIPFTVGDAETAAGNLTLGAASSNPSVIPVSNVVFGGSGANRTVALTPASGQAGSSTITVTVADANGGTSSQSFVVTVNANTPPSIANITDQTTTAGVPIGPVSFAVSDAQTPAGSLILSATTSNPTLIPVASVVFGGSGGTRTITITPASRQSGASTLTVTLTDGHGATESDSFVVTVNANTPPSIANITDKTATLGSVIGPVSFAVSDAQTAAGNLTLSVSSSNPTLVPVGNVVFGGSGGTRTVTITPAAGQTGSSTLTVTLTDGQGATASDSFMVTVIAPNTPPTLSAIVDQSVEAGASTEAIAFTVGDHETVAANLTPSAASSNPSIVPVTNIVFGGSGANRTVTITPATSPTGSANITVIVSDGEATASRTFKVTSRKPAPTKGRITVRKNGHGGVLPEVDGLELVIGQSYLLKAVPDTGNLFAGWKGDMQSPGATLTFVMSSNLVLEANFMANPFLPAKGVYNGLFHEADAVRQESSGGFTLKLTDRGTFTASLQMGNRKLPFSGRFELDGHATNAVRLNPTNVLAVELTMPGDGSNDPISGRLYNDEWEAQLVVDRATFHASTNPAPFAGKYTLVLPSPADAEAPAGDGFGRVTISAAGVVTFAGSLADGTKVSDSVTLSKAGAWPLYAPLYAGKGSVLSWMTFTNLSETDLAGALSWIRPAQPKAKFYTNSFAVQTEVVGSHYSAPESKTNRVIEIENGLVTLTGGGLADALVNAISIAPNSKVTNLGTNKLSLTFTAGTGLFTGRVLNPETGKTLTLQGAVLQKQNHGAGFFLGATGSGRVALE